MKQEHVKVLPAIGFVEATKKGFKNLFNFTGRARRSEFWWFFTLVIGVWLILNFIWLVSGLWSKPSGELSNFEHILFVVGAFLLGFFPIPLLLSCIVRRLHDTAHSGTLAISWGVVGLLSFTAFFAELTYELTTLRNHDTNSVRELGLTVVGFLFLVFIVMLIILSYFASKDSQKDNNKYGESPKYIKD